jgi:hypothetical protein
MQTLDIRLSALGRKPLGLGHVPQPSILNLNPPQVEKMQDEIDDKELRWLELAEMVEGG